MSYNGYVNRDKVRAKIAETGLSIQQFAEKIGYSRNALYRWLCTCEGMRADSLIDLCNGLDCKVEDLI